MKVKYIGESDPVCLIHGKVYDCLGAELIGMPHPYRMLISEEKAQELIDTYTLEEG